MHVNTGLVQDIDPEIYIPVARLEFFQVFRRIKMIMEIDDRHIYAPLLISGILGFENIRF